MKAKVFFLTILIVSLYSCCPKDKQKLVSSDLIEAWNPYNDEDKVFFHNENNEIDSIEVVSIDKSFNNLGHWCDLKIEAIKTNMEGDLLSHLGINLEYNSISFSLDINNKHKYYHYRFDKENTEQNSPEFYSNIVIGSTSYNDVFGLENDSIIVYYGKSIGIIGYKVGESTFVKN